jgi:hypothetical protein
VVYNGDIYKSAGGTGTFTAQSAGTQQWYGISVNPSTGDVWASVIGGDIYKTSFNLLVQGRIVAGNIDIDGNTVGHAAKDVQKPSSNGTPGYVLETVDGTSNNTQWVANGTGSGIGYSGSCGTGQWLVYYDAYHAACVPAPTWNTTGADQAGAAATVQSNLNTHTGTTLAGGAHGGLPNPSGLGISRYTAENSTAVTSDIGGTWTTVVSVLVSVAGSGAELNAWGSLYLSCGSSPTAAFARITVDGTAAVNRLAQNVPASAWATFSPIGFASLSYGVHTIALQIASINGSTCRVEGTTGDHATFIVHTFAF